MKYRKLGTTELDVSVICLGTMTWGEQNTQEEGFQQMNYSVERGINFFDTADMYSVGASEEVLGRAVRDMTRRDQVVIATKAYFPLGAGPNDRGLSRKHLFEAIDGSLRRLGTDHVDLSTASIRILLSKRPLTH